MTIQALPTDTAQLIAAAQVLTDAASVVKELVDNALDAKAAIVDVLLSSDTIDRIEVRDNGHGVAPEDLQALGRRAYTSKLRTIEDLRQLGGSSLGFRGEALASAVLLGDVSITTRTEGEATGTAFRLRPGGGFDIKDQCSHPVGTTVSMRRMFSKLPVRQRLAIKNSARQTSKIRELIKAYALARSSVRFTVKILGPDNPGWTFVPQAQNGLRGVVSRAIGRNVAAQCIEVGKNISLDRSHTPLDLSIQAVVAGPHADYSKLAGNQYISVDARPLSSRHGIAKKITAAYISRYRHYIESISKTSSGTSPFLCLNILCSSGTYDLNIEAAKDDILFDDEPKVMACIEELFKTTYEALSVCEVSIGDDSTLNHEPSHDGHDLLRLQSDREIANNDVSVSAEVLSSTDESERRPNQMLNEEDGALTHIQSMQAGPKSVGYRRPVLPSKGFARDLRSTKFDCLPASHSNKMSSTAGENEMASSNINNVPKILDSWLADASNSTSTTAGNWVEQESHTPEGQVQYVESHRFRREHVSCNPFKNTHPKQGLNTKNNIEERIHEHYDQGDVQDGWTDDVYISDVRSHRTRPALMEEEMLLDKEADMSCLRQNHSPYHDRGDSYENRSLLRTPPPTQSRHRQAKLGSVKKPLISLFRPVTKTIVQNGDCHVAAALDFEHRKEAATRQLQKQLRLDAEGSTFMPTKNSLLSPSDRTVPDVTIETSYPIISGAIEDQEQMSTKGIMPSNDPRAYLMRHRRSMASASGLRSSLTKMKSALLPLERIPDNARTCCTIRGITVSIATIKHDAELFRKIDVYVGRGSSNVGLKVPLHEQESVQHMFDTVYDNWRKSFASCLPSSE